MSPPSFILLSESASPGQFEKAISRIPGGERLFVVPRHLQGLPGSEPALNLDQPHAHLRLQLIDSAIASLRPKTIIADLPGLELVMPMLARHPKLASALVICAGDEKRKKLKALGSHSGRYELESA